jgi:hypothetical protein
MRPSNLPAAPFSGSSTRRSDDPSTLPTFSSGCSRIATSFARRSAGLDNDTVGRWHSVFDYLAPARLGCGAPPPARPSVIVARAPDSPGPPGSLHKPLDGGVRRPSVGDLSAEGPAADVAGDRRRTRPMLCSGRCAVTVTGRCVVLAVQRRSGGRAARAASGGRRQLRAAVRGGGRGCRRSPGSCRRRW